MPMGSRDAMVWTARTAPMAAMASMANQAVTGTMGLQVSQAVTGTMGSPAVTEVTAHRVNLEATGRRDAMELTASLPTRLLSLVATPAHRLSGSHR